MKTFGDSESGQGSLEYLIITAAVLAIAAVVILFLTGAFGQAGTGASIAACQSATSDCLNKVATLGAANAVTYCQTVCGNGCTDARTGQPIAHDASNKTAAQYCAEGNLPGLNAVFGGNV